MAMSYQQMCDEWAQQRVEADGLNALADSGATVPQLRQAAIGLAEKWHARYPQYKDHWAGPEWRLVRATKDVSTKGGLTMRAGDYLLARPQTEHERASYIAHTFDKRLRSFVYVHSLLRQAEVSVEANSVQWLE